MQWSFINECKEYQDCLISVDSSFRDNTINKYGSSIFSMKKDLVWIHSESFACMYVSMLDVCCVLTVYTLLHYCIIFYTFLANKCIKSKTNVIDLIEHLKDQKSKLHLVK